MRLPAIPLLLSAALCSLPAMAAGPVGEQAAARKPLEAYIRRGGKPGGAS